MRYLIITGLSILLFACGNNSVKDTPPALDTLANVSFIKYSENRNAGIITFYTTDADSIWNNPQWMNTIKYKMEQQATSFALVELFNSQANTPDVTQAGIEYEEDYLYEMVASYETLANGLHRFCCGGVDEKLQFKHCEKY